MRTSGTETTYLGDEHDCYFATDPRVNRDLSVKGKNVLITGAGRGVGRAIAVFLTHASASSITAVALEQDEVDSTVEECKQINPHLKTKAVALDVTDASKVKNLIDEVENDFGTVDILVCNAARPPQFLPTVESDPKIWWDTVSSTLQGAFLFSRFCIPAMQKTGGRIIFTSSAGAHINAGIGSYTIAKLGMIRLAEIIHRENYDYNIKAFSYHPGRIRTRFFTDFEDAVKGKPIREGSYVTEGLENEDKSAKTAFNALSQGIWDTPELPAGLVTAMAAGKLDFMSGRYVDASVNIQDYNNKKDEIIAKDLHRVRLHAGDDIFLPVLEY